MALLFGIAGLAVMALVLSNADVIVCAIGAASTDCEPPAAILDE